MRVWKHCITILAAICISLPLLACEGKGKSQKGELVIWQTETDPDAKAVLEKVRLQFEEAHPNVDVKIESVPWGSLSTKLTTSLLSDTPPDIAHIQPFMAYSLVERGLLSPLDDLIQTLESRNGPILPAVKDLQEFDGHRYGIAYAVGVTGWTYDIRKSGGLALPYGPNTTDAITTSQFLDYASAVKAANPTSTVLLPGGSPFFIDQLFGELVANAGGRLYDPRARQWLFSSPEAQKALEFFVALRQRGLLAQDWQAQQYNDQFPRLAGTRDVFVTPVTYARASVAISRTTAQAQRPNDGSSATFKFMSPPVFDSARHPIATIDCEPFVVFERTRNESIGNKTKRELALEFLQMFYERSNYLEFVKTVPIHLTPVFQTLAEDQAYIQSIRPEWRAWHDHTMVFLKDRDATRPILVPGTGAATLSDELKNPYLLSLQAEGLISKAVLEALTTDNPDVRAILLRTQDQASNLIRPPSER